MRKSLHGALAGGLATLAMVGSAAAAGGMPQLDVHDFAPQHGLARDRFRDPLPRDVAARRAGDRRHAGQAPGQDPGRSRRGRKANEETRALVAAYEKRLADAREEARRLTREQGEADGAVATARFNALHDRLAKQIDEAEKRIARQRDDVMAGLEHMASDIGRDGLCQARRPAGRPGRARRQDHQRRSRETADDRHGLGGGRRR